MIASLGQYPTAGPVSQLLVAQFEMAPTPKVLELGAGSGALIHAVLDRWGDACIHAAEIDAGICVDLKRRYPQIRLVQSDGLSGQLSSELALDDGSIDIAVCNPPYRRLQNTKHFRSLFERAGLKSCVRFPLVSSDLVFLARNLALLRVGGELGIILPDTLLTGHEFQALRVDLMSRHQVAGIIQLPDNAFQHAEARAHILLLKKGGTTSDLVRLQRANSQGIVTESLMVAPQDLLRRMDFEYACWAQGIPPSANQTTLADLNLQILRGRRTKLDCVRYAWSFVHTSDLPEQPCRDLELESDSCPEHQLCAEPGDILVGRVGKRCVGRVAMVTSGAAVVTDCVYRVRPPTKHLNAVWKALSSEFGQRWLRVHSHGVCARCISKQDLIQFPVTLRESPDFGAKSAPPPSSPDND